MQTIVEASLKKAEKLQREMREAVASLLQFASPTGASFDALLTTVSELRLQSIAVCLLPLTLQFLVALAFLFLHTVF